MERIDWVNGKVPINRTNLNGMQDNIEKSCVAVSKTQPTSNESVWIKKGKNAFNGNNVLIVNTAHTTNNISKNDISITTTGNYANSRFKVMIPNEFINKKVLISFNAISTVNGSTTNIRNTLYISSGNNDNGDILTQVLTTTKTRYNVTFTPTTEEIYITLYGNLADYSTFITMTISEIQLEQNLTATDYEEYIEKEIYVKNDNGVFEKFINADDIPQETDEVLLGNGTYYKKYGKVVSVYGQSRGGVTLTNDYLELGILPEGARPNRQILGIWTTIGVNTSGLVVIEANGSVKIFGGTTNSAYWGFNITFIVD